MDGLCKRSNIIMNNTTHNSSYHHHFKTGCKGCVMVMSLLLLLTGLAKAGVASAQYHYCSWNRMTLQIPLGEKWSTDAEVQARWQNSVGSRNMFDEALLFSYRQWVYYKPDDRFRISLSPFAYFSAHPYIMKYGYEKLKPTGEYRATIAVEAQQQVLPRLNINGRMGAEYRMLRNSDDNWRTRYRVGSRYDINKKYSISGNYELLFTTHIADVNTHLDNERIWAMMGRTINRKLRAEVGLMHMRRKMTQNSTLVNEGDLLLNVTYSVGSYKH